MEERDIEGGIIESFGNGRLHLDHVAALAGADDQAIAWFLSGAGFDTECRQTPRSLWIFETDGVTPFTTTVWVIVGVHHFPTDLWSFAFVSVSAGLSNGDEIVINIGESANTGIAFFADHAEFFGRHLYLGIVIVEADDRGARACGSDCLTAAVGLHFNIIDVESNGDVL